MITTRQRKFIIIMLRLRIWKVVTQMRLPEIRASFGTRWLLKRIKEKQVVDVLHHAPCCPANHYHKGRLVFDYCNCGATRL